jgi:hypothetical protein
MNHGTPDIADGNFPAIEDDFGDGLREDLRARVKAELEPGERLLWVARSLPPDVATGMGYFIAFGIGLLLVACGVGVLSFSFGRQSVPTSDSIVGGIVLMLLGCATDVGTIWARVRAGVERIRQANTLYAVTDRRAISWVPEAKDDAVRVHSLGQGRIKDVSRVEKPDGTGTLEFTLTPQTLEYPAHKEEFKYIPEVRRVEQLVRNHLTSPA